eukprot:962652_1
MKLCFYAFCSGNSSREVSAYSATKRQLEGSQFFSSSVSEIVELHHVGISSPFELFSGFSGAILSFGLNEKDAANTISLINMLRKSIVAMSSRFPVLVRGLVNDGLKDAIAQDWPALCFDIGQFERQFQLILESQSPFSCIVALRSQILTYWESQHHEELAALKALDVSREDPASGERRKVLLDKLLKSLVPHQILPLELMVETNAVVEHLQTLVHDIRVAAESSSPSAQQSEPSPMVISEGIEAGAEAEPENETFEFFVSDVEGIKKRDLNKSVSGITGKFRDIT